MTPDFDVLLRGPTECGGQPFQLRVVEGDRGTHLGHLVLTALRRELDEPGPTIAGRS